MVTMDEYRTATAAIEPTDHLAAISLLFTSIANVKAIIIFCEDLFE